MRFYHLLVSISVITTGLSSANADCLPATVETSQLYEEDNWNHTRDSLLTLAEITYNDPSARLPARAYWDNTKQSLVLPYPKEQGGPIALSKEFVENVSRHIEQALATGGAEAVIFPDMGHSHLFIPEKIWHEKYAKYSVPAMSVMMAEIFKDPEIKVLYHTAEQLGMLDQDKNVINDPYVRRRHAMRNILGSNDKVTDIAFLQNPESKANTVRELPGYYWYSGGFNISANKNGCFSYVHNGRVMHFDISMYDLPNR